MENSVYLDHNATTALRPCAADAMGEAMALTGNPSSVHRFGRVARRLVEDGREAVAALVGASPADVIFTSGGSEANNLCLRGTDRTTIFASAVEHPSVLHASEDIVEVTVDGDGVVDLSALGDLLSRNEAPALVSVMMANNETGVIQPIEEISRIAHAHGALVHCDAVQAAGKVPLSMSRLGVDLMTLSAHKIGGPSGVGAVVVANGVTLAALNRGGGQERGVRAGSENVVGIAGFSAAAAVAPSQEDQFREIAEWRDSLESDLADTAPIQIFGCGVRRLPNTTCVSMPGVEAETQVMAFDLDGIAVSAGSACSSGKVEPSHVLKAMGIGAGEADCAIRVSLGWNNRKADVTRFVEAWRKLYTRLGQAQGLAEAV